MPRFMQPRTALARLVEDEEAPVGARCRALRQLAHPPLLLLRRLLVDTAKRTKPVPARLRAIAALAFAHEVQLRKVKASFRGRKQKQDKTSSNALGIS
ncbi:MAG: hypothetical protein ABSC15_17560 [Terriglobales bacterium]|jgi:hypothetical protein